MSSMPGNTGIKQQQQAQKTQGIAPCKRIARSKRAAFVPQAVSNGELSQSLAQGVRAIKANSPSVAEAPKLQPVPGTEILPPTAPTPPPPPPSQGMDFVLDKLSYQELANKSASRTSSVIGGSLDQAGSSVKGALESIKVDDAAAQASAAAADAVNALGSVVGGTVSGATDAVGAGAAAASAAASEVAGQLNSAASQLQQLFDTLVSEAGKEAAIVQDNINTLTGGVQSTASGAVSSVAGQVEAQLTQLLNQLPAPIKDALTAGASEAYHAAQVAASNPTAAGAAGVGVGVGLPFLLWIAANAGYAGSFSAVQAEQLLQTQEALLIDIRPESKRLAAGVPELKRGARGKGTALSPILLPPSISRRVRNADALALEMLGAQIAGLARVSPGTKVIIMDESGSTAKKVAKAASAAGVRRAYVLQGGFRAWTAAGFKVKTGTTEYDSNPLGAVSDVAESVVEEATSLVKAPQNAAIAGGAVLALAAVLFNYHLVFRTIGVFGVEATIILRALTYESPQDAIDDLTGLYESVVGLAALPVKAAEAAASVAGKLQGGSSEPQRQTNE